MLHAIEGTSDDGAIEEGVDPWFADELGQNVQKLLRYGEWNPHFYATGKRSNQRLNSWVAPMPPRERC